MHIKRLFLGIAVGSLLAACTNGEQAGPEQSTPATATPAASPRPAAPPRPAKPVPAPEGQKGVDMLAAAGVKLDFPHEVLYDILDTSGSGKPRHRVLVEVLDGDFGNVVEQFGQSLAALGYTRMGDKNTNGRLDQIFEAKGKPTFYLLMQPAGMGPKLAHPSSVGSIHIMWNIAPGSR